MLSWDKEVQVIKPSLWLSRTVSRTREVASRLYIRQQLLSALIHRLSRSKLLSTVYSTLISSNLPTRELLTSIRSLPCSPASCWCQAKSHWKRVSTRSSLRSKKSTRNLRKIKRRKEMAREKALQKQKLQDAINWHNYFMHIPEIQKIYKIIICIWVIRSNNTNSNVFESKWLLSF